MKKSGCIFALRSVTLLLPALLSLNGCGHIPLPAPTDAAQECVVPQAPEVITDGSAADFIDMMSEAIEKCRALLGYKINE